MVRGYVVSLACVMLLAGGADPGAKKKIGTKNAFSKEVKMILEKSDKVVLVSLFPDPKKLEPAGGFHGYKVLGRVDVVDKGKKKTRTEVLHALRKAVTDSKGDIAKCFVPRHGLIVTRYGKQQQDTKTAEFLICFECLHMYVFSDAKKETLTITALPAILFNRVLREAKIKLPPQAK